jgi:hypothetical protein
VSPEGGESGGGGPRDLQGEWRRRRRFGAWRLDSSAREEEGSEGKLLGTPVELGEASNGGENRRPWRARSGARAEEEERLRVGKREGRERERHGGRGSYPRRAERRRESQRGDAADGIGGDTQLLLRVLRKTMG